MIVLRIALRGYLKRLVWRDDVPPTRFFLAGRDQECRPRPARKSLRPWHSLLSRQLLGLSLIGCMLLAGCGPALSPYHPLVGKWQLRQGPAASAQEITFLPSGSVVLDSKTRGTYTISAEQVLIAYNRQQSSYTYGISGDTLTLDAPNGSATYRRISTCWSKDEPNPCGT